MPEKNPQISKEKTRRFWVTSLLVFVILAVFILFIKFVFESTTVHNLNALTTLRNLLIVVIPSLVWVIIYYLQDRKEPEPVPFIFLGVLIGLALASLWGTPMRNLLQVETIMGSKLLNPYIASFLIIATLDSIALFIGLRFIFVYLYEFDQVIDGIVYGATIGCGYAAFFSLHTLFKMESFSLFYASFAISVNILLYASVGAAMGFFVGKAKFGKRHRSIYLIISLIIGVLLIGIYNSVNAGVINSMKSILSKGFLIGLGIALFSMIIILIETYRLTSGRTSLIHRQDKFPIDWIIALILILLIAIPIVLSLISLRPETVLVNDVSFEHPSTMYPYLTFGKERWFPVQGEGEQVLVSKIDNCSKMVFDLRSFDENPLPSYSVVNNFSLDTTSTLLPKNHTGLTDLSDSTIKIGSIEGTRHFYVLVKKDNDSYNPAVKFGFWDMFGNEKSGFYVINYSIPLDNKENGLRIAKKISESIRIN